ncbi:IS5 family transposase [Bacteroidota bacterium]
MIKYTPSSQLTLENFKHPFLQQLDANNRWVQLAELVPWDELAGIYAKNLDPNAGRLSVDLRMVIGALIIKHKLSLTDRDTVLMISENMYMQYFCGLQSMQTRLPFDASLFVDIRKRLGAEEFDEFNEIVIHRSENLKPKRKRIIKGGKSDDHNKDDHSGGKSAEAGGEKDPEKKEIPNQGKLKLDASIADQYITSPNDLKLVSRAREETERLVDVLYKKGCFDKKPRTYRRNARKEYLGLAKKRNKSKKEIRVSIGKQLRYVKRNISTIGKMLDKVEKEGDGTFPLNQRDQKIFWVIQHIFNQQMYMYQNKVHSCSDRIVNIYQPYVRPMVRGKDRANVEFGAKINISEVEGFVRCDHIGWDNYDEGGDLKLQVERFKQLYGCYPELLLGDRKYLTRENRRYLKEHNIRIVGKPLGRPPKEKLSGYRKYKTRKEQNMRNHVEGKFGQGKNGYELNEIRAKRKDTSESWISAILFVMNLTKLMKVTVVYGNFLAQSVLRLLRVYFSPVVKYDGGLVIKTKAVPA